jgi:ATP/maltotriose-dependent transcriptional regulator MalT/DNA-binding SARP family transcriptional activator
MSVVLHRTRLFRRLDDARGSPIIWIVGPPGIGKTTLVASYLQTRKVRPLWYQVDERDADIATLFHYLSVACQQIAPRYRELLPNLTPEYLLGLPVFTRRFFEALYGRLRPPTVVVLDNYQDVPPTSQFHEIMEAGLAEVPQGLSVIIMSRAAPPPSLARLQAARTMEVLEEEELRLREKEAAAIVQLLTKHRGYRLSVSQVTRLHHRTNGWVAGLVLLLAQRKNGNREHESEVHHTPELVFDYLAKEVMKGLKPEVQEFLLKTAVFPSMTAAMADRLTSMTSAEDVLAELVKARLFVEERRQPQRVYQFHPLFRDCLLFLAQTRYSREQLADIRGAAAQVLEDAGRIEEAIQLFQQTGQTAEQVRLILTAAPGLLAQGRAKTVEGWIRSLPSHVVDQMPWLLFWLGSARFPFDPAEAQQCFERAFQSFQAQHDFAGTLLAWSGVVESILFSWHDFRRLDPWIDLIPIVFPPDHSSVQPDIEVRVVCSIFTALLWRRTHPPLIEPWTERMWALLRASSEVNQIALISFSLTTYYTWMGDMPKASSCIALGKELLRSRPLPPLAHIHFNLAESYIALFTGDIELANRLVMEGKKIRQDSGVAILDAPLLGMEIYIQLAKGDVAAAEKVLEDMQIPLMGTVQASFYAYQAGAAAIWKGDVVRALEHIHSALQMVVSVGWPWLEAACWLASAQLWHEAGDRDEAVRRLDSAKILCNGIRSKALEFALSITEAKFAFDERREQEGLTCLKRAFAIGRALNLIDQPWLRPTVMAQLCMKALEAGLERDYVHRLVRKRRLVPDPPPVSIDGWPWTVTITTLGTFRLTVDDEPVVSTGKAQRRPLAFLKALIAHGGEDIVEGQITDALWPDAEGDMGHQACATTLHRLRRLLGHDRVVQLKEGKFSLHPSLTWVDAWSFERLVTAAEHVKPIEDHVRSTALYEQAFALYQGCFLAEEPDESWATATRDRLRHTYIRLVRRLLHEEEHQGRQDQGISYLQQALRIEPLVEEFYQLLMSRLYDIGQCAEALAVYDQCRAVLAAALHETPSQETESIRRTLMS